MLTNLLKANIFVHLIVNRLTLRL